MANVVMSQIDYYPTESDLNELFTLYGGFNPEFTNRFVKDYASAKRNFKVGANQIDQNTYDIEQLTIRVTANEVSIAALDVRLTVAESEIDTLQTDLAAHVAETSAHGATGNIVGTDNYASASIGGTVLLAAAVADAVDSTVDVTSPDATAAPAAYNQTQVQSIVTLANETKADLNQLVLDVNAAISQLNALLASMRTAKQLEL